MSLPLGLPEPSGDAIRTLERAAAEQMRLSEFTKALARKDEASAQEGFRKAKQFRAAAHDLRMALHALKKES